MLERISLGGMTVRDLCPLNDTDPPLSFTRDLGMKTAAFSPTYRTPSIDASTYWQPQGMRP